MRAINYHIGIIQVVVKVCGTIQRRHGPMQTCLCHMELRMILRLGRSITHQIQVPMKTRWKKKEKKRKKKIMKITKRRHLLLPLVHLLKNGEMLHGKLDVKELLQKVTFKHWHALLVVARSTLQHHHRHQNHIEHLHHHLFVNFHH